MPRALVIDDESYVRATILLVLEANGFAVVAVENARLGLSELKKTQVDAPRFDLAIVDIYMPEMDGVQLIKELRERSPTLPIIAMSGVFIRGSDRTVLDILPTAPGLSGITCLKKPFRPNDLMQAIQKAVGAAAKQ